MADIKTLRIENTDVKVQEAVEASEAKAGSTLATSIAGKSTVAVSATGTATEIVSYITIDGVEKKLASGPTEYVKNAEVIEGGWNEGDLESDKFKLTKQDGTTTPTFIPKNIKDAVTNKITVGDTSSSSDKDYLIVEGDKLIIYHYTTESGHTSYNITFQPKAGIIALISDIPDVSSKQDILTEVTTGTTLKCNNYAKLEINTDITLELDLIAGKVPEYHAMVTLGIGKTITLTGVAHVKVSDDTNIGVTEAVDSIIKNKSKTENQILELSIQNGYCFGFVWGAEVPPIKFSEDTWENIAANCAALEAGSLTTAQFCAKYLKDDGTAISSMDDFVGLTHTLSINSVEHTVRVIGTQHDTISGGTTKAALTFQLVELFSDSTDAKITQKFNASYDSPYFNIWNDGTRSCDIRNYLRGTFKGYLPTNLQSKIKTIKKKTSAGNTSTTVNELDEDIFLLSVKEMCSDAAIQAAKDASHWGTSPDVLKQEGNQYKFYANNLPDTDPYNWDSTLTDAQKAIVIKKDKSGAAYTWWLRSPGVASNDFAFGVNDTGYVSYSIVSIAYGVAPAFAI